MTKTDLHNLFTAVADAHNAATRVLTANGPGPAYEAAADAYNAANPGPISVTVF